MPKEKSIDVLNATGMCQHGNFPASCVSCTKEQEMSREIESFVSEELERELSPERKGEMTKHLSAVLDFFDQAEIPVYLAGGGGLDLLDGKWDRDHQDLDMAIFKKDAKKFYDAAMRAGFRLSDYVDQENKSLTIDGIMSADRHNALVHQGNDKGDTFEIMFLDEEGDTQALYDQASPVAFDGREVRLQPVEVILYHKLKDGRRKDFRDVKKIWGTLTEQQQQQTGNLLRTAGIRFEIGGKDVQDVSTLLESATTEDAEKHTVFFGAERLKDLETGMYKELMSRCDEIFKLKQTVGDRQDFFDDMAKKYHGLMPEQRQVLEVMRDVLYADPPSTLDQFKSWARQFVDKKDEFKKRALYEYVSEKLWTVKSSEVR